MKKTHHILLTILFVLSLAACTSPAAAVTPAPATSDDAAPATGFVTFADPTLEALVRGAMGKLEGDITLAEAQSVTRMDLSNAWQQYLPEMTPITNLGGLEAFTNLTSLDLSAHAVSDISPLAGLTSLTSLSLAGNPVIDLSPLAGLTNLKLLILSNSQAQDYETLANLVNLQVLLLDGSTITDVTPLAGLTNLHTLYLDNCVVDDLSPLENIYANLVTKDFSMPSTLMELGFSMDSDKHEANFESEDATFTINHLGWGFPSKEDNQNIIRMSMYLEGGYFLSVGYYQVHKAYLCQMDKEGQPPMNYLYYMADSSFTVSPEDRPYVEQMIRAAMGVMEGEEILYAPIRFFNDAITNTFDMSPEKLFSLPYEPLSLKSLGFVPEETPGIFKREGFDSIITIDLTDALDKEFDIVFFQPINDEYRVNISYHAAEKKLYVKADDNYQGGASFWFSMDSGEHIDEWCSDNAMTVEEYYTKAYNDPAIEDIYQHSADLMVQYIYETFGLTLEELVALPTGE